MPVRATKRGAERTPLKGDWDVVVCGASFGGLAVTRELSRTPARVLVLDRYQIGERQTSACGIPTQWLDALGLRAGLQQTFPEIVVHTPHGTTRWKLPWTFSTFDYRTLCRLLWEQCGDVMFETAKVDGRTSSVVHTDRGDVTAPLIVPGARRAAHRRRILRSAPARQGPDAAARRRRRRRGHALPGQLDPAPA